VGDERDSGHAASIGGPRRYAAGIAGADTLYDRVGGLTYFRDASTMLVNRPA
jgi:hypothetical protein